MFLPSQDVDLDLSEDHSPDAVVVHGVLPVRGKPGKGTILVIKYQDISLSVCLFVCTEGSR